MSASTRAWAGPLLAVVVIGWVADAHSAAAPTPPSTTTLTATSDGRFTDVAGTLSIGFVSTPVVVPDPGSTATSFVLGVDDDTQTLSMVPPTAYGADAETTASERALLFLDESFEAIELLANTQTRLGPFPAAYFVARITLGDGRRAVLYGATVVRADVVHYVFYTDVGGDDGDQGRAFVESYAVTIDPLPGATTTTIAPGAPTTTASSSTTSTASFEGQWWIRFPNQADVSLRASSEDGFAYAEYAATVGDDALSVRVTEFPAAMEWDAIDAAATEAARSGSTVTASEVVAVGGSPAARFRLADADGATEVLLVRSGGQLYRVAYVDAGERSSNAADDFIDSFELR